jgi:hypothetical protein
MHHFKLLFLFFLLAGISPSMNAQSYVVEGIETFSSNGIKPIKNGKEVVGYVIFYKTDKADSKNDNYGFDLLNEKLNKVSTKKVVLPRSALLLGTVYNGEALGLMFYNQNKQNYIFKSYDKTLKELGSVITEKPNKYERAALQQITTAETNSVYGIQAVTGKGFVRAGYGKSKDQYGLTFYDNEFKQKWHYETPSESKDFESFLISDINTQYITGVTIRRKGLMSRKFEYFLTVFDVETGKITIDVSVEKPKQQLSISSTNLLEATDQVVLQGEYYDENDKPGVDKSKGFYLKIYDLKTGKPVSEKLFSWNKDIDKLFNAKGKESLDNNYLNYPHTLFKAANGHYYIVFEQFKKAASGVGIAVVALGGEASLVKIKVGNIWLLELDGDLKPVTIKYYEKDDTNVYLPPGAGIVGAGLLGYYTKSVGGFDYQFLQQSADESTFTVSYINYDRENGEKTKILVGNMFLAKDGSLNYDKVDMTAAKKTSLSLYPSQEGFIMLSTYFRKQDKLELRLVKLNY